MLWHVPVHILSPSHPVHKNVQTLSCVGVCVRVCVVNSLYDAQAAALREDTDAESACLERAEACPQCSSDSEFLSIWRSLAHQTGKQRTHLFCGLHYVKMQDRGSAYGVMAEVVDKISPETPISLN